MYREDTSTSSEDDTSTAGTAPTTADMCRSKLRKGQKVVECTGCGYISDRRANVTRHYGRIHGRLKKYKECSACGDRLQTKGEFYMHCKKYHHELWVSLHTANHVYRMGQTAAESKLKSVKKACKKADSKDEPARRTGLATRSSSRLKAQKVGSVQKVVFDRDSFSTDSVEEEFSTTSTDFSSSNSMDKVSDTNLNSSFDSCNSVQDVFLNSSTDSSTCNIRKSSVATPNRGIQISFGWCTSKENVLPSLAHLPIKKRFRSALGDITNVYQDVNNNSLVPLKRLDEQCQAFIKGIDIDELNAILTLRNIKRTA